MNAHDCAINLGSSRGVRRSAACLRSFETTGQEKYLWLAAAPLLSPRGTRIPLRLRPGLHGNDADGIRCTWRFCASRRQGRRSESRHGQRQPHSREGVLSRMDDFVQGTWWARTARAARSARSRSSRSRRRGSSADRTRLRMRLPAAGISGRSHLKDCGKAALDILLGCRPGRHADAHCGLTLPDSAAAPTGAFLLDSSDHVAGAIRIPERD